MPLESVEFKTDEELVAERNKKLNGGIQDFENLPLDIQLGLEPDQIYLKPFQRPELKQSQTPGFFKTAGHEFIEQNELVQSYNGAGNFLEHLNALSDDVPADWTPFREDALNGIDKKYWSYITDALSPKEQQARREKILSKQSEIESYNNGSFLAKLIGGGAGALMGPSSLLFPLSSTIKYAKTGQNVIKNIAEIAPNLTLQSVAHNALIEGTKEGGNLEDFVIDSMVDATAGIALVGGAAGVTGFVTGGQLFEARKALKLNREGFDVRFNVDKEGKLNENQPFIASPLPNTNLSAAEVNAAQSFLDSHMAKEGLFKLIPGFSKAVGKISPTVRMLTSEFSTTAEFMNRLVSHSIVTEGVAQGKALNSNFETLSWGIFARSKMMSWTLEGLRAQANGLELGKTEESTMKQFMTLRSKNESYSREQFGEAVAEAIRTGESHSNKAINEAAQILREHLDTTYRRFLKAYGLSEEILPPRTAVGYLMRNYNQDAVNLNREQWVDVVSTALREQDELIERVHAPVNALKERLDKLIEFKLGETAEDRAISNEIATLRTELRQANKELLQQITDNPDLQILLEERNLLSTQDRDELRALLEPINVFEEQVEKQADLVAAGKKVRAGTKEGAIKAKTTKAKSKNVETLQKTQENLEIQQKKLDEMRIELNRMKSELNQRALDGEIKSSFFKVHPETGYVNWLNPDEAPKLRKVYEDDNARMMAALDYRDVILNRTPEQLGQQILGTLSGGNLENPLSKRSLMIPDITLQNGGFLSNDLTKNVAIYDSILGKKAAFKEVFSDFGSEDGIEGITKALKDELERKDLELAKKPEQERIKGRQKLTKTFDKNIEDIRAAYANAMGNSNRSNKTRKISKAIRDFSVATRLGAVPLTMITDLAAIFVNHSFMDVMKGGMIPFIKTANGLIKSAEGAAYRENAAHLGIATEHLGSAMSDRFWNNSTQTSVTGTGKIATALENIAHLSGNLFGTNYVDNMLQRLAGNVTQSKIMSYMFKFKEGTLSKKELTNLLQLGIDPNQWAERFIGQFKQHGGEKTKVGGYYSNYYDWHDSESVVKMGDAIRNGVRQSILKKGIGDAPFWTNDPVWGMVTHLKGWLFAAFNRYTVPTMQRIDSEKALGMGLMLLMGAMVDPLRKWSRGEEYDFSDPKKFAWDTLSNSGVMGIMTDFLQDANVLTHGEFLGNMQNDKYRDRTFLGVLGGPLGGTADDILNVFTSFASGKINQQDMNRFVRLIPFTQAWYLRYLSNKLVEQFDLPENRNQATGWFGD